MALTLARDAGRGGREVAGILAERLARHPGIAQVDVAGPGFLNIALDGGARARTVRDVLDLGARYGHNRSLAGTRVTVTHDGEARAAAVAEAANRLLAACGAEPGERRERVRVRAAGESAEELTRRLGPDAYRWAMLRPAASDRPCVDPSRLLAQRESNPLFRVRYAHARSRALLRNASDLGIDRTAAATTGDENDENHDAIDELVEALADHPRLIEAAARHRAPDRLARQLERVADAFFRFHDTCPVLPRGDEKPSAAHRARLALAEAAGTVLAGGLTLLGISAPERL